MRDAVSRTNGDTLASSNCLTDAAPDSVSDARSDG